MAPEVPPVKAEVPQVKTDRSLGDLFTELTSNTTALVRQEIALAQTEMTQKAGRFAKNTAFLAAGALVAYAGLLFLIAAIVAGLYAAGLYLWLSSLIVGAVVAAIGGGLVMKGIGAMKAEGLAPRNTIETLKEDAKWMKDQTK